MSARQWKPGDVGVVNDGSRCHLTTGGWFWLRFDTECMDQEQVAREARPLLVLDPRDREQMERLADHPAMRGNPMKREPLINALTAAVRSLLAPPRPDEPKLLGAVVEDATGTVWVLCVLAVNTPKRWRRASAFDNTPLTAWAEIDAVRVLSPGYTPDADA